MPPNQLIEDVKFVLWGSRQEESKFKAESRLAAAFLQAVSRPAALLLSRLKIGNSDFISG